MTHKFKHVSFHNGYAHTLCSREIVTGKASKNIKDVTCRQCMVAWGKLLKALPDAFPEEKKS